MREWTGQPRRPATDEEAQALASALRLRILRLCLDEPLTNKEIALALGRDPGSTLHHVRRLVRTGFLAAQAERRGNRNAREVPYLATGKSWQLDTPARRAMLDAFLEEAAEAGLGNLQTSRLGLRLTRTELLEFRERLQALLDEYARRSPHPDGEPWSVFLALHPDVGRRNRDADFRPLVSPWNNDD